MKGVEEGDLPHPFAYMSSLEHGILCFECLASASLPFLVLSTCVEYACCNPAIFSGLLSSPFAELLVGY